MNKRHYEHTLPNIRGSLSNTYNHTTKYLFIEWDDGWNTDFFTLPVIGFASTNLNFKSVFVRFVRVVRIPSPRFINFHLSSGGMIADNHFK